MSFINNARSGSQLNLLCLIYRILHQSPNKFTEKELQDYCAPDELFKSEESGKRFRGELTFWLTPPHQLWSTDDEGKLFLDLPDSSSGSTFSDVAHQLRHRLMQIEFKDILGDNDEYRASKAIRSFAYILTQDQYVIFKNELTRENIDKSFAANFGDYSLNNSEKSYFIEFCSFLGISERAGAKEHLDPTRLIRSFLSQVFQGDRELKASDFIKKLSVCVPIIDYGKYNLDVRNAIGAEVDMPNSLSMNLSHALNRLNEERTIKFAKTSDDISAVTLNLPNGIKEQISSVVFEGGEE